MSTTQAYHIVFTKYKKRGNKEYAYQITTYRDKTTKQIKQHKKYLSTVINKEKQIIQKTNKNQPKNEKLILDFGDSYLLNTFLQTHYQKQLKNIFQEKTQTLTNLLTYRLCQTSAMTHANIWHQGNYTKILYKNTNLTGQRISDFLADIGDEQLHRTFFKEYLTQNNQQKNAAIIDITSLPTQTHIPSPPGVEADKK
jgi:hypothetical protein